MLPPFRFPPSSHRARPSLRFLRCLSCDVQANDMWSCNKLNLTAYLVAGDSCCGLGLAQHTLCDHYRFDHDQHYVGDKSRNFHAALAFCASLLLVNWHPVFIAECDPSCVTQARFEFDVSCSEGLVVNVTPRVVPYVFLVCFVVVDCSVWQFSSINWHGLLEKNSVANFVMTRARGAPVLLSTVCVHRS